MTDKPQYVLVPVEPTDEMLEAGDNEQKLDYDLGKVWRAMIAAAPGDAPPTVEMVQGDRIDAITIRRQVCSEILDIMKTYHEQDARGYVDTPGGLEHMGDVWRLFQKWKDALTAINGGK